MGVWPPPHLGINHHLLGPPTSKLCSKARTKVSHTQLCNLHGYPACDWYLYASFWRGPAGVVKTKLLNAKCCITSPFKHTYNIHYIHNNKYKDNNSKPEFCVDFSCFCTLCPCTIAAVLFFFSFLFFPPSFLYSRCLK